MKTQMFLIRILLIMLTFPFYFSCETPPPPPPPAVPVTYYLSYDALLSTSSAPDGGWQYITNFVYPSSVTSCEWSIHLNNNITKGEFGYDLIFWSETQTSVEVEFILKEDDVETVLASKEMVIPFHGETIAVSHTAEIENHPLDGENPLSGKGGELILRMTYLAGTDAVEILYDGASGTIGCASITVYQDE
jgi:hypothetical protein